MGSTEKILGFSSMKGLFVLQFVALGFAMPQQEPIEPRQLQPRGICANLPGFVGSLNRIVGGQDAPSPIPWQVSVRTGQDGGRHYCGGTILDSLTSKSITPTLWPEMLTDIRVKILPFLISGFTMLRLGIPTLWITIL